LIGTLVNALKHHGLRPDADVDELADMLFRVVEGKSTPADRAEVAAIIADATALLGD
jgi:hypothetical protein